MVVFSFFCLVILLLLSSRLWFYPFLVLFHNFGFSANLMVLYLFCFLLKITKLAANITLDINFLYKPNVQLINAENKTKIIFRIYFIVSFTTV